MKRNQKMAGIAVAAVAAAMVMAGCGANDAENATWSSIDTPAESKAENTTGKTTEAASESTAENGAGNAVENSDGQTYSDVENGTAKVKYTGKGDVPAYFELTENALNIYIYPTEIICDLTSGELHVCQSNLSEEEIRQLNTKKRFPVGEWTYMFKGITRPYSAFYRTNGNQTQLLVKTEGNGPSGTQALIISGIAAIASLIALSFVVVFLRRSKKKQNSMPTKD